MRRKCSTKYNNSHKLQLEEASNTAMFQIIYTMYISNIPFSSTMESKRKWKIYQHNRITNFPKYVSYKYIVEDICEPFILKKFAVH